MSEKHLSLLGIDNKIIDDIYKYVTDEEIMQYYFGDFVPGTKHLCPFQKEKTPSFYIGYFLDKYGNKRLKWVRFGMFEGRSYSPIDFVKFLYNESFRDACERIYNDIYLNNDFSCDHKFEKIELKPLLAAITKRRATKEDIAFWARYNINPKILKKFNVFPAQSYYIGKDSNNFILKFKHTLDCPMYGYQHGEGFTCYRPFAEPENRFRKYNIKEELMGWDQLPFIGDLVVITKSLKDIMVFDSIGIPAVAPQQEKAEISLEKIEILKDYYDKVVVVYDNDFTGVYNADKLCSWAGLQKWFIPYEYSCKDPSDLVDKYGINEFIKIWKKNH